MGAPGEPTAGASKGLLLLPTPVPGIGQLLPFVCPIGQRKSGHRAGQTLSFAELAIRPRLDLHAKSARLGNAENYRVCRSQTADVAQVPVRQETAVFPAEIERNSPAKTASLTAFFSGNFNVFHGTTEQEPNQNQWLAKGRR